MLSNENMKKIEELFDRKFDRKLEENSTSLLKQIREEVKYQISELKREIPTELRIDFGKVWEEIRYLRAVIETHIELHSSPQ